MRDWFKQNSSNVWSWTILIAGSVGVFLAGRGTSFQQFGVGLLVASVSLLISITVFEVIWQITARWFDRWTKTDTFRHSPKSWPDNR